MPEQAIEKAELLQLRSLLDAQTRLRELAEAGYADTVAILWQIARAALPEEMDQRRREDPQFEDAPPKMLGDWIVAQLTAKHHRLRLLGRADLSQRLEAALAMASQLQEEVKTLQEDRGQLQRRLASLRTVETQLAARDAQVADLQVRLDRLQKETLQLRLGGTGPLDEEKAPAPRKDASPHWFAEWQRSHHFGLDSALVSLMGDTGYTLPGTLILALFQASHLPSPDPTSGTALRLFERVKEADMVAVEELRTSKRQHLQLARLTERGREAYRMLHPGQQAVQPDCDRLLPRHGSPEQVGLVLQAHGILLAYGATNLDICPLPHGLSSGGTFQAAIVANLNDKPVHVLCFLGTEEPVELSWADYATVTREFHIFVPHSKVQSGVISQVTRYSMDSTTPVDLRVCNLAAYTAGGPLWTYERQLAW